MEIKRKALGKGLEELFGGEAVNYNEYEESITKMTPKEEIKEIPISEIRPNPYQPRKQFDQDALDDLAASIKEHGVFQPIILKKSSIKGYEIVAGERRCKASKIAGKKTIPAIVKEFSDEDMMQIAVLENLQREDLTPLEEAAAYEQMIDRLKITHEELAKRVGKSRSYVTNMLGLLNLPEEVKDLVNDKKLSMTHARTLSKMKDEEKMIELAKKIINNNLNVRSVEKMTSKKTSKPRKNYQTYENTLRDIYDCKVEIKTRKIIFSFSNEKELYQLLEKLGVNDE